jgi:hypothetical protein
MYGNEVMRRIFGFKIEKGEGNWTKLHNKELNTFYFTPNFIRVIK